MKQAQLTDGNWTSSAAEIQPALVQGDKNERSGRGRPEMEATLCESAATHAGEVAAKHFPELPVDAINWECSEAGFAAAIGAR